MRPHRPAGAEPPADRVPSSEAMSQSSFATITRTLLEWYDRYRRDLPWRAAPGIKPDPYHVWLSEVMLQQTTVAAVQPYYARFLRLWPNVEALAAAPRDRILKQWAGLGYYARARNLHDCAQAVMQHHGGRFPATEAGLRQLPGIGDYTAAAIAAIAFGRPATVVDGNVERVVARLFAVEPPLPEARPLIKRLAAGLASRRRPGDFAQATMDFGATLCTPRSPACAICPVKLQCRARALGAPTAYPHRAPKRVRPQRFGAAAVIQRSDGAVLVRTRPSSGLLGGMTEFLGTPWTQTPADLAVLQNVADLEFCRRGVVDHVFTHFALRLDVYAGRASRSDPPDGCRWVTAEMLGTEPVPTVMRKVMHAARRDLEGSAIVALDPDSLGFVGFEGAYQKRPGHGENHQAQPAQRARKGHEMAEPDGRREPT